MQQRYCFSFDCWFLLPFYSQCGWSLGPSHCRCSTKVHSWRPDADYHFLGWGTSASEQCHWPLGLLTLSSASDIQNCIWSFLLGSLYSLIAWTRDITVWCSSYLWIDLQFASWTPLNLNSILPLYCHGLYLGKGLGKQLRGLTLKSLTYLSASESLLLAPLHRTLTMFRLLLTNL